MEFLVPFTALIVLSLFLIIMAATLNGPPPWWHYCHWSDLTWWQRKEMQDAIADLRSELRTAKQQAQQPATPPPAPVPQIIEHRHVVVHVNSTQSHPQAPPKLLAQAERSNAYVVKGANGWEFRDKRTDRLIAVQANRLIEAKP